MNPTRIPYPLARIVGVLAWLCWQAADWWTTHLERLKEAKRCAL